MIKCFKCRQTINIKIDRYIDLKINEGKKLLENHYWHLKCYEEWFNERVMLTIQKQMNNSMNMMQPFIKNLVENVKGVM